MKKVSLLVLLAIVASSLLMAAIPTAMARFTVINKSGYDVFIKLEGSGVTEAFYYLTIPAGDRDVPMVKVFTVMNDLYTRTTWQCNGYKSEGTLLVDGNVRLTFIPCGEKSCGRYWGYTIWNKCDVFAAYEAWIKAGHDPALFNPKDPMYGLNMFGWDRHRFAGEPKMEKVVYFKYLAVYKPQYFKYMKLPWVAGKVLWSIAYKYAGWWNFGCGTWAYRIRTYQLPYGCAWRYQY